MEASVIAEVSALVMKITGVQLGDRQRLMVETRLRRRIGDLGLANEHEYLKYLRAHLADETEALISLLTTHHTFFFREFQHFQFLADGALEALVKAARARGDRKIRVWSAACSRGQESYSLAMFLHEHLPKIDREMDFEILGTDVDRESVEIARNGVYNKREIKQIPAVYLGQNWSNGSGEIAEFARAKKILRDRCQFKPMNLLDSAAYAIHGRFDLILCRNVFIYFTPEQIKKISQHLFEALHPAGVFMVGISETLSGLGLPVKPVGPSIYMRDTLGQAGAPSAALAKAKSDPASSANAADKKTPEASTAPLRVVCVDDSPSVLAILKQVLPEKHGFTVVGTAKSGKEAITVIKDLAPDLVTLDIHMPEMTGLEYLRQNWHKAHPPVVMVSSVAREDADLALQCLAAGASDYVEKPALADLEGRGDELRMKLKCASMRRHSKPSALDQQIAVRSLPSPRPKTAILALAGLGDVARILAFLGEIKRLAIPVVILTEGIGGAISAMASELERASGVRVRLIEDKVAPSTEHVLLGSLSTHWHAFTKDREAKDTSVLVFGELSSKASSTLTSWNGAQVLLEDLPRMSGNTAACVSDVVPATSFAYMAATFLGQKDMREKVKEAKADCLMTSFDGEVITFMLSREILITAATKDHTNGCALSLSQTAISGSQIAAALRKIESFLKLTVEQCEVKVLGTPEGIASYRAVAPQRLAHAKVVAKEGLRLEALFYPKSGRLRVATDFASTVALRPSVSASSVSKPATKPAPASREEKIAKTPPVTPAKTGKIRVLVVDDSLTIRKLLTKVLSEDPSMEVVAAIEHPSEVEAAIAKLRPDVITLDIHMPEMDGVTLLKKIMPKTPLPVVMITSVSREEGPLVLEALEAGAIDYIQKPSMDQLTQLAPLIVEKVKIAASAKLNTSQKVAGKPTRLRGNFRAHTNASTLIAIGASTGGTEALKDLLIRMPEHIPPILIVQHIPPVFSRSFAQRLNELCPFEVKEAADGDAVQANRVLVAPGGTQMRIKAHGRGYVVEVFDGPPVNRHKPSVDVLFDSAAEVVGANAIGVLLTGMGADGARGLLKMRQIGSHTVAQDEASCVVFGMPREAIAIGAAEKIAHLYQIPECLVSWLETRKSA